MRNPCARKLRKVLWLDAALGLSFGLLGLHFLEPAAVLLGFPLALTRFIALANLVYGLSAFTLANFRRTPLAGMKAMILANWIWTGISVAMCWRYAGQAAPLGVLFLVGQIPVVGGLSWLEEHLLAEAIQEQGPSQG